MLQEANKCHGQRRELRMETAFLGFLAFPQLARRGGAVCCLKDKEEANVCLLSSAKGFAWRAEGCFVSVQRTFVQNFWVGALSPDHIRSHVGRERTAWNLTGVGEGEKKGGFLLQAQSLPQACGNVEVAMGANPSWWALRPFKIVHGYWFC